MLYLHLRRPSVNSVVNNWSYKKNHKRQNGRKGRYTLIKVQKKSQSQDRKS